jgi:hypothetical protein
MVAGYVDLQLVGNLKFVRGAVQLRSQSMDSCFNKFSFLSLLLSLPDEVGQTIENRIQDFRFGKVGEANEIGRMEFL